MSLIYDYKIITIIFVISQVDVGDGWAFTERANKGKDQAKQGERQRQTDRRWILSGTHEFVRITLKQIRGYGLSDFCLFVSHKVRAENGLFLKYAKQLNFKKTHPLTYCWERNDAPLVSFWSRVNYSSWAACHLSLPIIQCQHFQTWQHAASYPPVVRQQHSTSWLGATIAFCWLYFVEIRRVKLVWLCLRYFCCCF